MSVSVACVRCAAVVTRAAVACHDCNTTVDPIGHTPSSSEAGRTPSAATSYGGACTAVADVIYLLLFCRQMLDPGVKKPPFLAPPLLHED